MNKKGFTLIELTISITLLSLILLFAVRFLLIVRNNEDDISLETKLAINQSLISSKINKDIRMGKGIDTIECESIYSCNIVLKDYSRRNISISNDGLTLTYTDIDSDKVLFSRISNGDYKYIIENTSTVDIKKLRISVLNHEEYNADLVSTSDNNEITFLSKLLELNPTRLTRASFSDVLTTDNTGTLYTTTNTEDGSTVYYFAGNALNNWVKFGKCTSSSYNCTVGDDLYWRIIRTNETVEDGGIRLLYAGSGSVSATNAYIATGVTYSGTTANNDPMYAGYMWGTTGSLVNNRTNQTVHESTPASKITTWYTATFNNSSDSNTKDSSGNLLTNYINSSAIYCNDRSVGSGTYNTGSTTFDFAGSIRLSTNKTPTYACGASTSGYGNYFEGTSSTADKFTGSTTNSSGTTIGNGLLGATPAAIITADELAFAGGRRGSNNTSVWYYLNANYGESNTGQYGTWTMTPFYWAGAANNMRNYFVNGSSDSGYIGYELANFEGAVRPVISLKADVLWVGGDGSSTSPFEVSLAG